MALVPFNLFVTHDGKSKRQHVTCRYKCGDACSKPVRNTSDNEYFGDIAKAVSRRSVLQAGGVAVLAVGAGSALAACGTDEQPAATPTSSAAPAETPPGMKFDRRRTQQRGRRRHPRRLRTGRRDQLGRPGAARKRRSSTSATRPVPRSAAVRLQQRLRRAAADRRTAEPVPAGHQPRVRRPAVHVPRLQRRRPDPRAVRHRDRRDRHGRRGGRAHAGGGCGR